MDNNSPFDTNEFPPLVRCKPFEGPEFDVMMPLEVTELILSWETGVLSGGPPARRTLRVFREIPELKRHTQTGYRVFYELETPAGGGL